MRAALLFCLAACAPEPARVAAAPPLAPPPPVTALPPPSPPPSTSCLYLAALHGAREVHVRVMQNGHGGMYEAHFDLPEVTSSEGLGVASASFRRRPGAPVLVSAREAKIQPGAIDALISAFEVASAVVDAPDQRRFLSSDTSRSQSITIDVIHGRERAIFECDDGQDEPQAWRIRGCPEPVAHDARAALEKEVGAFLHRLGLWQVLDEARGRSSP